MREMDAFEQAYKNGYDAGRRDAEGRIVRCKECVHFNVYRLECHSRYMNGITDIDGFCSYGERRSDG